LSKPFVYKNLIMINILVNPSCPELVFTVATFILGIEKEHYSQRFVIMPFKPKELNRDLTSVQEALDHQLFKIIGHNYFNNKPKNCQNKYVLFGIRPQDEIDAKEIAFFFDKNSEEIIAWVDAHNWPDNLLAFLYSQSQNIFIDSTRTYLQNLCPQHEIKEEWIKAEEAMINKNINHPLAGRYLKSFMNLKNLDDQEGEGDEAKAFVLFNSIVNELVTGQENFGLTASEQTYDDNFKQASRHAENFSDQHPIFAEAKKKGRSVGCLVLDKFEDYFDAEEVMRRGLEKFPWLCVLRYRINERVFVVFSSKYLPIEKMVGDRADKLDFINLLKLLSVELLKYS